MIIRRVSKRGRRALRENRALQVACILLAYCLHIACIMQKPAIQMQGVCKQRNANNHFNMQRTCDRGVQARYLLTTTTTQRTMFGSHMMTTTKQPQIASPTVAVGAVAAAILPSVAAIATTTAPLITATTGDLRGVQTLLRQILPWTTAPTPMGCMWPTMW